MRQVLTATARKRPTLPAAKRGAKSWRWKGPRARPAEAQSVRLLSVLPPHFFNARRALSRQSQEQSMTTKVTVDAHGGWPVEVTTIDLGGPDGKESSRFTTTVSPQSKQDFYVHSYRELHLKERPLTPAEQPTT
jgi:hypothetical protein